MSGLRTEGEDLGQDLFSIPLGYHGFGNANKSSQDFTIRMDRYKLQRERTVMNRFLNCPLGIIVISVLMFFVALATDVFWLGRLTGHAFPTTMPVPKEFYNAFALPDLVLSLFLYVGSFGLMKLKKFGFVSSLVAMGMWIFDSLLVLGITKLNQIKIVGPCLFFAVSATVYLWAKKDLFH